MDLTFKDVLEQLDLRGMKPSDLFRLKLMSEDNDITVIGQGEFYKIDDFICLSECVVAFDGDTYMFPSLPVGHPYTRAITNTINKASKEGGCLSGVWVVIMDRTTLEEVTNNSDGEPVEAGVSVFVFFDAK